ncbi:mitochondrial fission ELM1 family protein [Sedimenticola selenatireducens]|uniref:mitochondrial fission ELM1 family protein n=1 Tax=Sedimenticola selenatireducens TaxID=191960 RepID=UPI003F4AA4C7
MRKLTVWCLSDGVPGHFNQTKGLIKSLEHGFRVEMLWIDSRLKAPPLRRLMRKLLNSNTQRYARWIEKLYATQIPAKRGSPDLIVSTGGNTAYINIALAHKYKCKNFFIGSLRGLDASLFTRVFTIEPVGAANNIVMQLAPTPVGWSELEAAGKQFKNNSSDHLWTMLIGGSTREYRYGSRDWSDIADSMNQLAARHHIKWLVTTSRRTDDAAEKILREQLDPAIIADAVWYKTEPRKIMAAYLGAGEQIFCTEDSLSMLTEAVSAGKPVTSIQPKDFKPEIRYENALCRLVAKGWISRVPASDLLSREYAESTKHTEDPNIQLWRQISESLDLLSKSLS